MPFTCRCASSDRKSESAEGLVRRLTRIAPGGAATLRVAFERASDSVGPLRFQVEGLPEGVAVAGGDTSIQAQDRSAEIRLEMAADAPPIGEAVPLRVAAMARMPRGMVRVDSPIRPMLVTAPAEE